MKISKVIIIIIVICACVALGIWSINKFILPVKVKGFVENLLQEKTGHEAVVGSVSYLPFNKFYLKDLALFETEPPRNRVLYINELSASIRLWPLLKEKALIARLGLKDVVTGPVRFNGVTSISLKRRPTPAPRPFVKRLDGMIKFTDFSLVMDKLPFVIESINGIVILEGDSVRLDEASFKYGDISYNIESALTDLDKNEPKGLFSINSNVLTSEGNLVLKDAYIQIKKIEGDLLGSSFNIMGDIKLPPDFSLNLYSEARIDLAGLAKFFPKLKYISDSLKPGGLCDAALFFNGKLQNIKDAEGSIKLSSNRIFLHDMALDDLYLDLRMKDGLINTHRLDLRPYHGILNGSFTMDLNQRMFPYSISFALKDSDLARFSSETNIIEEDIAGFISSRFLLRGYLTSIDTLHGKGWVTITNGHLWKTPLFGGVIELLGLPHLRSIVFREAAGNFIVDQRKISTQDLTFYSDRMNMSASGSVDFEGNLDLLLQTHIIQDMIEGHDDAAAIANLIISQAGNYMGNIVITGTLKKPKYRFKAQPIGDIFKKGLKKIGPDEIKEIEGLLKGILR